MATLRRTEAKAFFANERTFLHWMNMSVTLGSISAALLGEEVFGREREGERERERESERRDEGRTETGGKKNPKLTFF